MLNNAPRPKMDKQGNMKNKVGLFVPENKDKVIKLNDKGGLYYRSGWEKKLYTMLDLNPSVIMWGTEFMHIKYLENHYNEKGFMEQREHRYFPDVYFEMKRPDGTIAKILGEIKPFKETLKPVKPIKTTARKLESFEYEVKTWHKNILKWNAAIDFCKNRGLDFLIITEKYLFPHKLPKKK